MKSKLKELEGDWKNLPPWGRMTILVIFCLAILKWFPFMELLKLALYVVIVPLGAYQVFKWVLKNFEKEIESWKDSRE